LKRAIDSEATGNVTIDCADASGNGSLLLKGCTDSFFANNLVVYTGGATVPLATGFGSTSSVGAVTASNSGCGYYNNLIRAEAEINKYVYDKDIASDTVFEGNHYYATVAPGNASPWTSSTASYATIALWNGDGDVGANVAEVEGVDPEIKDFDNGEYEVTATAMIGVGYAHKVTLPFINGYDGEPFPTSDIDVGAVQTTNGPFHPVNL